MKFSAVEIKDNWSVQMEGDETVYPAKVPGTIQTDLQDNKRLPQPFYRDNEKEYQWVDKENWIYSNTILIDSADIKASAIFLNFTGLDTYAEVYLNDQTILNANNFFRAWRVNVKPYLQVGKNNLVVKIYSPTQIGLKKLQEQGYSLPASNDQSEVGGLGDKRVSVFTRKAPYHYGWDWGPRFVTMGIWKPVYIEFVQDAEIRDVFIEQQELNHEKASLLGHVEISAFGKGPFVCEVSNTETGEVLAMEMVETGNPEKSIELAFDINKPKLWWPAGYGKQNLYNLTVNLKKEKLLLHSWNVRIGLRKIEVVQEKDEYGKSFYFKVNGVPVFAKGANYIPNDNFLPNVSNSKYKHIVKSAADANMNMLRVWGGGIYENDIFYDLCDQYGILVWQDFMYACSMYPGDEAFLENAKLEAVEQVKRLRNHPSIALWCGNNEMDAAWCEWGENCGWGWKEKYSQVQRNEIWKAYDTLFHFILDEVVRLYNPQTFYWPSSPMADYGQVASYETRSGDMHYWGVWHGGDPFEDFEKVIPRFMSEYGFQSFPEFNTINEFTLPQDWDIYSEIMLKHQRSPIGNQKIQEYMEMYYKVPNNFRELLYTGQVLQAYGIGKAIDIHRINKPFCMGTLYWQLNDCWPGASWSGIDYYGNWKGLHYKVREAFKQTRIAAWQSGNEVEIYVLNDNPDLDNGVVQVGIYDFEGNNLYQENTQVSFSFDSSTQVFKLDLQTVAGNIDLQSSYLKSELFIEDELVNRSIHYFDFPKNLLLPKNDFKYSLKQEEDYYILLIEANKLVKDLAINIPGIHAGYSNNYFDLLPGEEVEVEIHPVSNTKEVTENSLVFHSLNDLNNKY